MSNTEKMRTADMDAETANIMRGREGLVENICKLSASIEVVGTVGFEGKKTIVYGNTYKEQAETGKKVFDKVPAFVGVIVKNISKEDIPYRAVEYRWSDDIMQYIGIEKDMLLKPGCERVLSKRAFVKLMSQPEFSFRASNVFVKPCCNTGKIMKKLEGQIMSVDNINKILDSYTVAYNDTTKSVNEYSFVLKADPKDETVDNMLTFAYLYDDAYIGKLTGTKKKNNSIDKPAINAFRLNEILNSK